MPNTTMIKVSMLFSQFSRLRCSTESYHVAPLSEPSSRKGWAALPTPFSPRPDLRPDLAGIPSHSCSGSQIGPFCTSLRGLEQWLTGQNASVFDQCHTTLLHKWLRIAEMPTDFIYGCCTLVPGQSVSGRHSEGHSTDLSQCGPPSGPVLQNVLKPFANEPKLGRPYPCPTVKNEHGASTRVGRNPRLDPLDAPAEQVDWRDSAGVGRPVEPGVVISASQPVKWRKTVCVVRPGQPEAVVPASQ